MKSVSAILLLAILGTGCRTQEISRESLPVPQPPAPSLPSAERVQVVCRPIYYMRTQDRSLIPAQEARAGEKFDASGVVLEIVEPSTYSGKIVALQFDFPENWNEYYRPDMLYTGIVDPRFIGRLIFLRDPGWPPVSANRLPEAPTPLLPSRPTVPLPRR